MSGLVSGLGTLLGGGTTSSSSTSSTPSSSTASTSSSSTSSSSSSTATAQNGDAGTNVYMLVVGYFGAGPMQTMGFYLTMADAQMAAGPIMAYSGHQAIWRVLALPVVAQNAS